MEYKAKELFDRYGLPTQKGIVVDSLDELEQKAAELVFPLVVKAQVQTGGRGKAGGIRFADDALQLDAACKSILGMDIKGHKVKKLLIVSKVEVISEWYLCIVLDRLSRAPMVIFSSQGGVDIEKTAGASPEKVLKASIDPLTGVNDYLPRYLLSKSGLGMEHFRQLSELLKKLYRLFCQCDCLLAEINPLVVTQGKGLMALDGKVSIDDSALGRQPDILAFRDSLAEDGQAVEARKSGFLYIPCDAGGNIGVMSNGSGMLMSCIDLISKQGMKVGAVLDLGGGATSGRIREAIGIVLSGGIKALFINIFGGITRCDEVAMGVRLAVEELSLEKLILVRFEGTNKEKGLEILASIKGNVVAVGGLREGVAELDARRGEL